MSSSLPSYSIHFMYVCITLQVIPYILNYYIVVDIIILNKILYLFDKIHLYLPLT